MKHLKLFPFFLYFFVAIESKAQVPFTAGNIVVLRVGNGSSIFTSSNGQTNPVYLDEYSPTGTKIQSITLPTSTIGGKKALTLPSINGAPNDGSVGLLTLSADGRFLAMTGYDTTANVPTPNLIAPSAMPRTIGLVKYDGTVNTGTALSDFSYGGQPTAAVTSNGTDIWAASSILSLANGIDPNSGISTSGLRYTTVGSTSSVQIESATSVKLRGLNIFNNQLYTSTYTNSPFVATVGSGLPKNSEQPLTQLNGVTLQGSQFVFFDENPAIPGPDVLYLIISIGIRKYSYDPINLKWVNDGTIGTNSDSYIGLTGTISGGTVTLFATRKGANTGAWSGGQIVNLIDASGYTLTANSFTGSPIVMADLTASSPSTYPADSYSFKGVALVPQQLPAQNISYPAIPIKTYGSVDFDPGATASSGLAVTYTSGNPAVATIVNNQVHIVGAGTAIISADQSGVNPQGTYSTFAPAATVTQVLTVNKAPLTVTANNASRLYGQANPVFSANISGFVNNETSAVLTTQPVVTSTATTTSIAGTYPIIPSGAAANNYSFNYVNGTLTIAATNQVITFSAIAAKTYGIADFDPGATSSSGLGIVYASSNTAVATILNGLVHIVGVGSTTITAAQPGNANYAAAANVVQTLTVSPAPQTLTFGPIAAKTYGDPDFNPASLSSLQTITYTSSNQFVASVVNGQVRINGAGTATITASVTSNPNYVDVAAQTQTLTVNKANQTITISSIPTLTRGIPYNLSVTVSSGLTPIVIVNDATVASVAGTTLTPLHIGSSTITINQPGNTNYNAATAVTANILVTDAAGDDIIVHQGMSPNGDGINDVFLIENIKQFPDNHVVVINRNGAKVYDATGYNNASVVFNGIGNNGATASPGTYFYQVEYTANGVRKTQKGYLVITR
jgi:gliding motility-associated-like protein